MASPDASSSSTSPPPPPLSRLPVLLPLLASPASARDAASPPLHLLPGGELRSSRLIHRQSSIGIEWVSTSHVYPAAYPRSHPESTAPPCSSVESRDNEADLLGTAKSKDVESQQRHRDLARFEEIKARYSGGLASFYPPETEQEAQERAKELAAMAYPQLWSCVQRLVPVEVPGGLKARERIARARRGQRLKGEQEEGYTLILAHANGFHKETWEETIRSLLESLPDTLRIEEIWSLDSLGAGESGALVKETVGDVFSWLDAARDIEQLVTRCLPEMGNEAFGPRWPPTQLGARAPRERSGAMQKGRRQRRHRRFIGVGHSVSGAAMAMLAGTRPGLFDAVILIDPVTGHKDSFSKHLDQPYTGLNQPAATGAIVRRHTWLSGKAAGEYFRSKPFFKGWDRRVLDSYTRFCLRPLTVPGGGGAVTLATSRWSEAAVFASSAIGCFGLAALEHGGTCNDDATPTKIWHLSASSSRSVQRDVDTTAIEKAIKRGAADGRFGAGSGAERLEKEKADHLVVQQMPDFVGKKLADVLRKMLLSKAEEGFKPPGARL